MSCGDIIVFNISNAVTETDYTNNYKEYSLVCERDDTREEESEIPDEELPEDAREEENPFMDGEGWRDYSKEKFFKFKSDRE